MELQQVAIVPFYEISGLIQSKLCLAGHTNMAWSLVIHCDLVSESWPEQRLFVRPTVIIK